MSEISLTVRYEGSPRRTITGARTVAFGRDPRLAPAGIPNGADVVCLTSPAQRPIESMSRLVCLAVFDGALWALKNPTEHARPVVVRFADRTVVDVNPGTQVVLHDLCRVEYSTVGYGRFCFDLEPIPTGGTQRSDIEGCGDAHVTVPGIRLEDTDHKIFCLLAAHLFYPTLPPLDERAVGARLHLSHHTVTNRVKRVRKRLNRQGIVLAPKTAVVAATLRSYGIVTRAHVDQHLDQLQAPED